MASLSTDFPIFVCRFNFYRSLETAKYRANSTWIFAKKYAWYEMFHFGNNQCEWINATVADFPAVFSYLELLDLSWNWQIQNHENKIQFSWGQSTNAIGARCKSRATHHLRNKRNGSEMVTFDNKCTSSKQRQKLISWHAAAAI